jgi:type IV pilus assembly protein PilB
MITELDTEHFGQQLLNEGVLSVNELTNATKKAKNHGESVITHLVEQKLVDEQKLALAACQESGLDFFDLDQHLISQECLALIDGDLLKQHTLLPLCVRDNQLLIGIADPFDDSGLQQIKFRTTMAVQPVVVEYSKLLALREQWLSDNQHDLSGLLNVDKNEYQAPAASESFQTLDSDDRDEQSGPIVRFINKIIANAIRLKASDIHFEPYEKESRVRFRIDGILREVFRPPLTWQLRLASRIKIMADLDITERRVPQDGRIRVSSDGAEMIDLRVNTLPMQHGEKIVMRVLDSSAATIGIDRLGFEDDQRQLYLDMLGKPQGMILVTGPTGSGKTVSLYTGLNLLNTDDRNISTAEDPVEINMFGINQTQINPKTHYDFPMALRAFLRQDPDVIMVGEIRDLETAEIAVKAAQTGHLVLSTLHTNSSAETINRLLNMGLSTFNVATSISLIIAQRLARKLCVKCRKPVGPLPDDVIKQEGLDKIGIDIDQFTLYTAVGCNHCHEGYSGRVGIYETMKITPEISSVILNGGTSMDILRAAQQQGFRSMRISALRKVAAGVISMQEANRITTD